MLNIREYVFIPFDHPIRKKMYVQVSQSHPVPLILDDRAKFQEDTVRAVHAFFRKHIEGQMKPDRFKPVGQWIQLGLPLEAAQGFMQPYQWIGGMWWQFGSIHVPLKLGPKPIRGMKDERVTAVNYHYLTARHCTTYTTDVHKSVVDHVRGVKTFTGLQLVGPMVKCEVLKPMPAVGTYTGARVVQGVDVPIW